MIIGDRAIRVLAEREPHKLPWADLGVDVVLESTGIFTSREAASAHLEAGARKVLISGARLWRRLDCGVWGQRRQATEKPQVVSNASCTTNCLAPVAFVLNRAIGITRGYMTTIHAYTGDQRTVDTLHGDLRRARAAAAP